MRRAPNSAATLGLAAGLAWLLPLRKGVRATGRFDRSTATAMWAAYGLGAAPTRTVRDGATAAPAAKAARCNVR